ncbi:hypothetical protein [Paenibacillus gallinarum]|uniref:DUF4261 domain-containing protein n=1 Tax=Paenibacillus gallinarum TaxID=2762232 RepID=A0ABR8SZY7_9BACL|nr:hypothetical protein [Paenibacillus gallinarum]MBD7969080.1 hypothetical protein [Paenibacillus gallinarum]
MNDKLVLCIPGQWKDEEKLIRKLTKKSRGEYSLTSGLLLDTKRNRAFEIRIEEQDPTLAEAFYLSSKGDFSDKTMQKVEKHTKVVYLSGYMGSAEAVQRMIAPVQMLLASGGVAVKIENSDKAFTPEEWSMIGEEARLDQLLNTMISYMQDEYYFYSCGMQMFGLPDVALSKETDPDASLQVMSQFLYLMMNASEGTEDKLSEFKLYGTTYQYHHQKGFFQEESSYINNPHGIYVLTEM